MISLVMIKFGAEDLQNRTVRQNTHDHARVENYDQTSLGPSASIALRLDRPAIAIGNE